MIVRLPSPSSRLVVGALVLAACGSKPPAAIGHRGGAASAPRLPWEAALVVDARFELWPETTEDRGAPRPLVVTIASVENQGGTRVYTLAWDDTSTGPSTVRVIGDQVLIGDAAPADMQTPWPGPVAGTMCFAQDFSNPDGCDDVCDAELCFSPDGGIVAIGGLYAPNFERYQAR